jgi:DNA-binding MarR family transcriptional regulator
MTDTDGGGQPDSLMQLLKRANQHVTSLHRGRRAALTMQFTVLRAVEEMTGSARQAWRCSPASIARPGQLVARLIDRGYLRRRRTKDDGRTNALRLSPARRQALKAAEPGAREVDQLLMAAVPMRYRRALLSLKRWQGMLLAAVPAVPEITAAAPRRSEQDHGRGCSGLIGPICLKRTTLAIDDEALEHAIDAHSTAVRPLASTDAE